MTLLIKSLEPVKELYNLWQPVYPFLAEHIRECYNRNDGSVADIGPFCGVIFALQKIKAGSSFSLVTFPSGMADFYREEAGRHNTTDVIEVIDSDAALKGVPDNTYDLILFRGALFFPSLFSLDFKAVYRVLRTGGIALIGGGFGKYTPSPVIDDIGKRSRELNLRAGKVEISEDMLRQEIQTGKIPGTIGLMSEGGLWVIMRK